MAVGYNSSIVTDELLIYLDPGNPKSYPGSGTALYDLSGYGRDATVNGAPTFTNYYFTITGDSTYISMPNAGLSPRVNNFTYSIWVWFSSLDSLDTLIENGSWTDTLLFRQTTGNMQVYAEGALIGQIAWTPSTSTWYNVVLIRSNNTVSMYINGTPTGTPIAMTTDVSLSNPNLWLMRSQHATGQWTSGRVSAFSVYGIALSPDQVIGNFAALRGRFGV